MKFTHATPLNVMKANAMKTGAVLLLTMSMSTIATVQAQDVPAPAPVPETALPQANFSDEQLESFVEVQNGIEEIREEYTARLEQTDDAEAAGKLQQEANLEMVEVVESNELDVETYNQIAQALQQDPALLQRVQAMMN